MPYICRDKDSRIISLKNVADHEHPEFLPATHIDIINFLTQEEDDDEENHHLTTKNTLQASDQDIARITEDLIYLLIDKNIILITELPQAVQNKLRNREKLRSQLNEASTNFLLDEDEGF